MIWRVCWIIIMGCRKTFRRHVSENAVKDERTILPKVICYCLCQRLKSPAKITKDSLFARRTKVRLII
jgi:hypothetical protein